MISRVRKRTSLYISHLGSWLRFFCGWGLIWGYWVEGRGSILCVCGGRDGFDPVCARGEVFWGFKVRFAGVLMVT